MMKFAMLYTIGVMVALFIASPLNRKLIELTKGKKRLLRKENDLMAIAMCSWFGVLFLLLGFMGVIVYRKFKKFKI
jgi:hypothetical protein